MKCILKINDPVLSSFLGKNEFESYHDFYNQFYEGILGGTIPIGDRIVAIEQTEFGWKIPLLSDIEIKYITELIQISLTQSIPENLELTVEDESVFIQPTDEANLSFANSTPYVYTLTKIFKPSSNPVLEGEDETSIVKNNVTKAVEEIQLLEPEREFYIRFEPDNAENVQTADPSTFKKFGVVGVLYEKVGGDFHRVYVKSASDKKAEITLDEREAMGLGWNNSKLLTFTIPDFSNPKYTARDNPVNEDVIASVLAIRQQSLSSPSDYFKVNEYFQEFPNTKPSITLKDFLQGREASINIATDTDRIFYKGNLFLRLDGEKVPTTRSSLKDPSNVIDLLKYDYSNDTGLLEEVVDYLNTLLSFKGGDVTFYSRGNKIVAYRHSKKVDNKIIRTPSEIVPISEIPELLSYAKINVDRFALNSGRTTYSVVDNKLTPVMKSADEWADFYLEHHTTRSRQININGKLTFTSAKSFVFNINTKRDQVLEEVEEQIKTPKIGNTEIEVNTEIPLSVFLDDSFINQTEGDVQDALKIVRFLSENDKSSKLLEGKKVKFVDDKGKDFKGIVNGDTIEINYNLIVNPTMIASVFAHEAIHLLTANWITQNPNDPLTQRLNKLIELVPSDIKDYYKNPYEILASIANPDISSKLKEVKVKDKSLFEEIADWIKDFFLNLFGVKKSDSLYDELINKIVTIATKDLVIEEKPTNKFGLKKRATESLPLGYDEESVQEFTNKYNIDKSSLKDLVRSIDGDLANFIHNKGLFQDFISGRLNSLTVFRNLFDEYVDITENQTSFTPQEEKFYSLLGDADFIEEYWLENTEFAKVRPYKGENKLVPIDEDSTIEESEKQEEEKQITDGEDITNDKFFERTGMEISSIDGADKLSRIFVKMLPAIERDELGPKMYSDEERIKYIQSNPSHSSHFISVGDKFIKFKLNSLGRIELNDYYFTWNTLADKLQNSLTLEEMLFKIETDPSILKIIPEAFVFASRLKDPIKNSFQAEVKQKIETAFKRTRVGIFVMLQDENGFYFIDEGKDIFSTAKNITNTNFLNNVTSDLSKFYDQETGQFAIKKYLETKKGLIREDGTLDIDKTEGVLGDKVLKELGFDFDKQTIWNATNENKDETYLDFKRSLLQFLLNFETIDIQIADFITRDHYKEEGVVKGLNAKFKKIIKREDSFKPITTSMMVKNAEGENQSVLSLFNSILKDKKYYNDATTVDELNQLVDRTNNDLFHYSISKRLMFNNNVRNGNKLRLDTLSGKKEIRKGSQSKGKLTVDLSEGEWFLFNYVSMFREGLIENTRAETASTCYGFRLDTWNPNFQQNTPFNITDIETVFSNGKYNVIPSSYVFRVWSDYLRGELSRIEKGGKTFGLFSNILSDDLKSKLKTVQDVDTYQNEIAESLSDFFNKRMEDYNYYFKLMGGEKAFKINDVETDLYKDYKKYGEVRKAWFDLNAMTLHVEETILFQGDTSEGWKYFKRAKAVQSTGIPVSTSPSMQEWVNKELNETSFGNILNVPFQIAPTYSSATIKDDVLESQYFKDKRFQEGYVESKKLFNEQLGITQNNIEEEAEKLLSAYKETNIGDGDAFIQADYYFALLNLTGSINQDQIKGFKALVYDFQKNAIDYFTKEELDQFQIKPLTPEQEEIRAEGMKLIADGKVVFPKLKFTQRGPGKGNQFTAVSKEIMDKFALTPLFPQFCKGKPLAMAMFKQMLREGLGYVKFESGTKISNFGVTDFIKRVESGELEVSFEDSKHTLKTEYLAEQIKTPNKVKEKNTFGSQFRKLIQSGLSLIGLDSLVREWEKLNQEFSSLTRQEVLSDFGITEEEGKLQFSNMDLPKIADILLKESRRRDLPENLTVFFDKYKQGLLKGESLDNYYKYLESSLGNQQIQNLLASIIKKIAVQKLGGAQLIQVSSSIFDRKLANKEGKTRELGFYHFKDGTIQAAECKVAMIGDFKNLLNLPEVKDRLEVNGKEDNILNRTDALNLLLLKDEFIEKYKKQLTIVGYRIPTQGFNSMEVMVIREFLPTFYGPTLVCPPEITVQSGTDYDYDKFSVLFPAIDKKGNMHSEGVKGVQNKMIEASSNILLHPINFHKLITPNSSEYIFGKVKPLLKNLNIQFEEPKGSMIFTTRGNFSKFRTLKGKNLLGIAAVWNTFYSLMQRHDWKLNEHYNILDFQGKTLVTSKVNPVLLSKEEQQKRLDSGGYSIKTPDTADGTSKSEVISQLINVTVDMPSDDTFGQTNFDITDFSAGIYASSVLGYDFESILNLWHQPVIYQYKSLIADLVKQDVKLWKAKLIAISEILEEEIPVSNYGSPLFDVFQKRLFEENGILDRLENQLKLQSPNFDIEKVNEQKIDLQQRAALAHYIKLLSQADSLRIVQSALNFDTSPDNNMMKVHQREDNYHKAVRSNLISKRNIDEVKLDSVISALYTSDILKGTIKRLFPILYSAKNINAFGQISSKYQDVEKAYRALTNDFLLAIVQSFGVHEGPIFNTAISFLQQNNSLVLTQEAKKIKKKLNKEGINMRLLNILVVNLSKQRRDRVFNQQIFLGFENSPDDKNKITEEFRTLLRREDTKKFAETLAIIGLVQSGWAKSPIYFSDLIPEEFITPIISNALDSFEKLTEKQQDKFRKNFLDHFKFYEGIALGRADGLAESFRLMDYTDELSSIYEETTEEPETEDISYEEVKPLQLESGNIEEKGELKMQPDNESEQLCLPF